MKKVKNTKRISFTQSFDELFEKPKLKTFESRKVKIWSLIAVAIVAFFASAPFLTVIVVTITTQSIINNSQKKIDKIKASQPYTEHDILKENLSLLHKPNYSNASPYTFKITSDKINFGNGFELNIKNSEGLNQYFKQDDFKIKAESGYSSMEQLAQYDFPNPDYKEMSSPISVFISGNLIESYEIQIDKAKGSWAKVYQLPDKWGVKTGYIINYNSPDSSYWPNHMRMSRYWIFSDGVGITVEDDANVTGTLTSDNKKSTTQEDLDVINKYSKGKLGELQENYEMTKIK
jgi:hypothetical protein